MNKEDFKDFVRLHPFVSKAVNENRITWQKAYEHYDIFGEDNWEFLEEKKETPKEIARPTITLPNLSDIDLGQVSKVLEQLTSVLGLAKELVGKNPTKATENVLFERFKD